MCLRGSPRRGAPCHPGPSGGEGDFPGDLERHVFGKQRPTGHLQRRDSERFDRRPGAAPLPVTRARIQRHLSAMIAPWSRAAIWNLLGDSGEDQRFPPRLSLLKNHQLETLLSQGGMFGGGKLCSPFPTFLLLSCCFPSSPARSLRPPLTQGLSDLAFLVLFPF